MVRNDLIISNEPIYAIMVELSLGVTVQRYRYKKYDGNETSFTIRYRIP